jgi:peroxin-7
MLIIGYSGQGNQLATRTMQPRPTLGELQTPGFAHYSLAWSPFVPNRLAMASSANYGLVGNGRLHVVHLDQGGLKVDKQ